MVTTNVHCRGQQVIKMDGPEIWVSDLYRSQRNHPAQQWQVCLAHYEIANMQMKILLLRAFVIHRRRTSSQENTHQFNIGVKRISVPEFIRSNSLINLKIYEQVLTS
jgi:hypothetical protein